MSSKHLMIVDGDYICHRSANIFHSMKHPQTGVPTGAVYGFIRELNTRIGQFMPDEVVVCFDHQPLWRKDLFPGYKERKLAATSIAIREAMEGQRRELYEGGGKDSGRASLLERLGIKVFRVAGQEADDGVMYVQEAWLNHTCKDRKEVTIISADKDLYQLLKYPGTCMFNPDARCTTPVMTATYFERIQQWPISRWAEFKAIMGCASDKVPGIGMRVGEKSIYRWLRDPSDIQLNPKHREHLNKFVHSPEYFRNLDLVDLERGVTVAQNRTATTAFDKADALWETGIPETSATQVWLSHTLERQRILHYEFGIKSKS